MKITRRSLLKLIPVGMITALLPSFAWARRRLSKVTHYSAQLNGDRYELHKHYANGTSEVLASGGYPRHAAKTVGMEIGSENVTLTINHKPVASSKFEDEVLRRAVLVGKENADWVY